MRFRERRCRTCQEVRACAGPKPPPKEVAIEASSANSLNGKWKGEVGLHGQLTLGVAANGVRATLRSGDDLYRLQGTIDGGKVSGKWGLAAECEKGSAYKGGFTIVYASNGEAEKLTLRLWEGETAGTSAKTFELERWISEVSHHMVHGDDDNHVDSTLRITAGIWKIGVGYAWE